MHTLLVFLLFSLLPLNILAQDVNNVEETVNNADSQERELTEKIEVTGSHIRQVDLEGKTPVLTLDRNYLDNTGYNSVGDVLRELSTNSFGSLRERSGSTTGGVSQVSLRGLGASRTLVLINGRRTAKDGTSGATDLNLIPLSATERIDVLKDSSSAIYGSDAIGGVVNIITKKDFNGAELSLSQNATQGKGGNRTTVSGTFGWSKGKARVLGTVQYRNNQEIYARDRDWLHSGYSFNSPVPNVIVGGIPQALDHCPADKLVSTGGSYTLCRFRWTDYATETPNIEQFNLYTNAQYDLNATTEFHLEMFGSRKELFSRYAPGVVALPVQGPFIDQLGREGVFPKHTAGDPVRVMWRALMLGPRDTEEVTNSFSVNAGVTQYFGETWEADLSLRTERIKRDHRNVNGYARYAPLAEAIESGECDIFRPNGTCNIKDKVAYAPYQIMNSDLNTVELKGNGELMDLPNGTLAAAIGAQYTFEKFSDDYDDLSIAGGVLGGGAGSEGRGSREVQALFTEFSIPVLKNMELNVAGRYDRYSDFGETFNPKVSLSYRPFSRLLLRASGGTGFKAPDMSTIYSQESEGYPTFIDEAGCALGAPGACSPAQYLTTYKRPRGLKEEKSVNAMVGAVFQATSSFSVGLDVFHTEIEDGIGISLKDLTEAELAGVDLARYNTTVNRNIDGSIESVVTQDLNIAQTRLNGADLELKFQQKFLGVGTLSINNTTSYLFEYKTQGFPGTPFKSILKENGSPQWRNMLAIGYQPSDALQFSAIGTTVGKHALTVEEEGDLESFTSWNTQIGYNMGGRWGKITFGVDNLFDTQPPTDTSNPSNPVVTSLYNNFGRIYSLGYTVRF